MKNMKIKVENNLDEIVVEFRRIGYRKSYDWNSHLETKWIQARANGCISNSAFNETPYCNQAITLAELKEM